MKHSEIGSCAEKPPSRRERTEHVAAPLTATPGERARLTHLRWLSIAAMAFLTLAVFPWLAPSHPLEPLLIITLSLAAANLALLGAASAWLVRPAGTLAQLLLDLFAWSAFLYFSGGVTNPAISLLLPLVAVGAAILPPPHAWALALAAMLAYSLLWRFHLPVRLVDADMAMHWHLAGMWLSFALSALTVVWFIVRLNAALARRDRALAASNDARARDAYVVGLGKLAAGAAHRLGTPLGTLRILSDDLVQRPGIGTTVREDLELMRHQIDHCRDILNALTHEAGQQRAESGGAVEVARWLENVLGRWRALRPGGACALECPPQAGARAVVADVSLADALLNLLDNAANANARNDAAAAGVSLEVKADDGWLVLAVKDRGAGLPPGADAAARPAPLPGETSGMGIGLILTRSAVEQHGGTLTFGPRPGGGTIARITLPLQDSI